MDGAGQGMSRVAAGVVLFLTGLQVNAGDWKGDLQVGAGYWAGDATYSIGGNVWTPEGGTERIPDKISELKFPLDVAYGSLGGRLQWKNRFEIYGTAMANGTDPSTKVTDSDWGFFPDSDENTLDIYSESDADLTAVSVDAGAVFWLLQGTVTNRCEWSVGLGPSVLYQHFDWKVSQLDQWNPSHPELGHVYDSGQVLSYQSDLVMPYLNVRAMIKANRIRGSLEVGIGPAVVRDEDDHMLRQILATTDMTGTGVKGSAEFRYDFSRRFFALARITAFSIEAWGTEMNKTYGGEDAGATWEIDHTFSLRSISTGLAVGYAF